MKIMNINNKKLIIHKLKYDLISYLFYLYLIF